MKKLISKQDWITFKECYKAGITWRGIKHVIRKDTYYYSMIKLWMFGKCKWKHNDLKEVACDLIGRMKTVYGKDFVNSKPLEKFQFYWKDDAEFKKSRIWTEMIVMLENYKLFGKLE